MDGSTEIPDLPTDIETSSICSDSSSSIKGSVTNASSIVLVQQHLKYGDISDKTSGNPTNFDSPRCKVCSKDITAKWGNTSNLFNHLKKYHSEVMLWLGVLLRLSHRYQRAKEVRMINKHLFNV